MNMPDDFPKAYEPHDVEKAWYPVWLERRYFHADEKSDKKPFSIVIPPPNVTGSLHMGHAFNVTLQDILARTRRMQGFNTCWLPGMDHAGIATQNVVEKQLAAQGVNRHEIGREEFLKRVWVWKEESGGQIFRQLQRLGASCDWERQRFTMDDGLTRAVREVFVHLYQEGLIYRDKYLINWCPRCHTALSDLEVEHEEMNGQLWYIRYPAPADAHEVIVATTRPETMLGDTAVAVHPEDARYQGLVGQRIKLPLTDREIPVIADHRVDREFGTGVVKVTPAHDHNDFQIGNDHQLERINIFTPEGVVNDAGGRFAGMDRFDARKAVVEALEAEGLLVKTEAHRNAVGHCYRCKTIVEPYLSLQWFVKTKPLAERAIKAVKQGQTTFHPKHWEHTFFDWLERIQDWCISRQIWWGHRIPAWYCATEGCPPIVVRDKPAACPHCKSTELRQDDDVLDTWFSSALWPFSTFGWPDQTAALKSFYPTTVLVTGFDIIFFWVARMMMMGLRFMGDVPFRDVYIHALVRDPQGQKMSKSKGNVVDPLAMMDRYGTDAFRFTLSAMAAQGRDIKLSEERISGYRNFCNKVWNACRFISMQCAGETIDLHNPPAKTHFSIADRWIQFRFETMVNTVTAAIDAYEFDVAAKTVYQFVWHEFCDWYLEAIKPVLQSPKGSPARVATVYTLWTIYEGTLRVMHPFMPFITEELWQRMHALRATPDAPVAKPRSIVVAPWPVVPKRPSYGKEIKSFEAIKDIISTIRMIRSRHLVPPASLVPAIVRTQDAPLQKMLGLHSHYIRSLAKLSRFELRITSVRQPGISMAIVGSTEVAVPLEGIIDLVDERQRLQKEMTKAQEVIRAIEQKLGNPQFIERAPEDIVATDRERLVSCREELAKLEQAVASLNA